MSYILYGKTLFLFRGAVRSVLPSVHDPPAGRLSTGEFPFNDIRVEAEDC